MTGRRPPTSMISTCDQWVRAHHEATTVIGADGRLTLTWHDAEQPADPDPQACLGRGLTVDRLCRIYRLDAQRVWRVSVGGTEEGIDYTAMADPEIFLEGLRDPAGIGIDANDRLFVADRGRRVVTIIDLWSRRTLRTVHLLGRPSGLVVSGLTAYAITRDPDRIERFTVSRGPRGEPLDPPPEAPTARPARISLLANGQPVVLWHTPEGQGLLTSGTRPVLEVGGVSDIVTDHDGALLLAPCAGTSAVRRVRPTSDDWVPGLPLETRGADGSGLVVLRDGKTAYWTAAGPRLAVASRVSYERSGTTITYRLDSGVPRNRWGRLFLDACLPKGTALTFATASSDDDEPLRAIPAAPADSADCKAHTPSPPLPPPEAAAALTTEQSLHRRRDTEDPWWRLAADERFDTFEAPVSAPPGRYLWVALNLRGDGRRTPWVRDLRVEHRTHRQLDRLPAVYREDPGRADFLERYLALPDGFLDDLDARAAARQILVAPHATPVEALDWLASFVGLLLDDRWAEAARRQLITEVVWLYRRRGTIAALSRYIELFLAGPDAGRTDRPGVAPIIVEHFRLRGVGRALGDEATATSQSVLGAGFRVGGTIGEPGTRPLDPEASTQSIFASHAHRFSVLIPRPLDAEEDSAVRHILDTERPAHTVYDLCTVSAGMRVGRGIHVGLSSIVGPTGGFEPVLTGASVLGRAGLLGGPTPGFSTTGGRVGRTRLA